MSLWSDSPSFLGSPRLLQSAVSRRHSPRSELGALVNPLFSEDEEEEKKSPVALFKPLRLSSPTEPDIGKEEDKREQVEANASPDKDEEKKAEADAEADASFPVALFQPLEESQLSLQSSAKPHKPLWESSDEESGFEQFLTRVRPRRDEEEEEEEEEEEDGEFADFIVPDDEVESSQCVDSSSDAGEEDEDSFPSPKMKSRNPQTLSVCTLMNPYY